LRLLSARRAHLTGEGRVMGKLKVSAAAAGSVKLARYHLDRKLPSARPVLSVLPSPSFPYLHSNITAYYHLHHAPFNFWQAYI
jgi:hypothetical protein